MIYLNFIKFDILTFYIVIKIFSHILIFPFNLRFNQIKYSIYKIHIKCTHTVNKNANYNYFLYFSILN